MSQDFYFICRNIGYLWGIVVVNEIIVNEGSRKNNKKLLIDN